MELTTRCLQRLKEVRNKDDLAISVALVDAGSTDGTAGAAQDALDGVSVLSVDANVYWAEGMARAEKFVFESWEITNEDFLVWLNDDVLLDSDALSRALNLIDGHPEGREAIYVGAMRSSDGTTTYGGIRRSRWNPLSIRLVEPQDRPVSVDTFHGNFLLVPYPVAKQLGGIDGAFGHHMADIDYGVRNRKQGKQNILLPGVYGTCDTEIPLCVSRKAAWAFYKSLKGSGHWKTRDHFLRKHSRIPRWPALLAMDFVQALRLLRSPRAKGEN